MFDKVFLIFEITPEYDLAIMKPGKDIYYTISRLLIGMQDILQEVKPD